MNAAVKLTPATIAQAPQLAALLNLAYRGEQGWTTEYHLIDGPRCSVADVQSSIADPQSVFLAYRQNDRLLGCICLEQVEEERQRAAHIGSFSVHPRHQAMGLGKALLSAAEQYATDQLDTRKFVMTVLSNRLELIAFYQRRGYRRDGITHPFPLHLDVGIPKGADLTFEQLSKSV